MSDTGNIKWVRFSVERKEIQAFMVAIKLTGWACTWKKRVKGKTGYYIAVNVFDGVTTGQILEFGRMLQNLIDAEKTV